MFVVAFLAFVSLALVDIAFWLVMRVRLMRIDSARNRIEWLSFRSGDDVLDTYAAQFPRSVLPRFCRFIFWTAITMAVFGVCAIVVLKGSSG
jgi:hypothetical protein